MGDGGPVGLEEIDMLPYARREARDVFPVATDPSEDNRSELVRRLVRTMDEDIDEEFWGQAVDGRDIWSLERKAGGHGQLRTLHTTGSEMWIGAGGVGRSS